MPGLDFVQTTLHIPFIISGPPIRGTTARQTRNAARGQSAPIVVAPDQPIRLVRMFCRVRRRHEPNRALFEPQFSRVMMPVRDFRVGLPRTGTETRNLRPANTRTACPARMAPHADDGNGFLVPSTKTHLCADNRKAVCWCIGANALCARKAVNVSALHGL